jgi:hypothetical protein
VGGIRAVVLVVAALAAALPAAAAPGFGAADDAPKYAPDGGAWLYGRLRTLGMTQSRFTVRWDPSQPATIQDKAFLDRSLPVAQRNGIRVVLDVYPAGAYALAPDPDVRVAQFAGYLQLLARTYPQVTDFIVGNEPNEAYFWQPQYGSDGELVSAAAFERLLAASYDALKAVNAGITVIAGGPSGSGNDRTSSSPVRFLQALGAAYRASGRTAPLMDKLGFHVYPGTNTDPPSKHYDWPNAGAADLDRIKQAIWDAFHGTGQPTFAEGPATGGLRFAIDEYGWQARIEPSLAWRYTGAENVPPVGEADQARIYSDLHSLLACDPTVADLMIFHLVDETDLGRFQSGLLRVDGSERPSFDAVRAAIAAAASCAAPHLWTHTETVLGAAATFDARDPWRRQRVFGLTATAAEPATGKAGIFRVGPARTLRTTEIERSLAGLAPTAPLLSVTKLVKAGYSPRLELRGRLAPGTYVYAVRLTAEMNPARAQTIVSAPFHVR